MTNANPDQTQQATFPVPPVNVGPGAAMPMTPGILTTTADSTTFDLAGAAVEATDGHIGKVSKSLHSLADGFLTVETGPWIFGRTVVIPAGVVNHIDAATGVVYLDASKEQVKGSPDVDESQLPALVKYYGPKVQSDPVQEQAAVVDPEA